MGGIFNAFQVSLTNLSNMREGISVVNENVANTNTPGYSRKRIIFKTGFPILKSYGVLGTGAQIETVESIRNNFIEQRLRSETETQGFFKGQSMPIMQLEAVFGDSGTSGIGVQLSKFFDAWLDLSSDPTSSPLRQAVVSEGEQTTQLIRSTSEQIDHLDQGNRKQISDVVKNVNSLLDELAEINKNLSPILASGSDGGDLFDQKTKLIRDLSSMMDIQTYVDDSGQQVITTSSGKLLLAGSEANHLSTEETIAGTTVTFKGNDISSDFQLGKLGGLLDFQNNTLTSFRSSLNDFARELAENLNNIHRSGQDINDQPGVDFFSFTAGSEASTIQVSISDPDAVATRGAGAGRADGTNALTIARLRDEAILGLGSHSFSEFYSEMVFEVGMVAQGNRNNILLQDRLVGELESYRESVSGVSLDEEAVKLMQYQRSYQASSKLIKTIDELMQDTLNIVN